MALAELVGALAPNDADAVPLGELVGALKIRKTRPST